MVGERRRLRRRRGVGRGVARVAAPIVVSAVLVVLAVGAVAQIGPASGPDRRAIDRSFAVLATPIVAHSNTSGAALNALVTRGPALERTVFIADLVSLATATTKDDRHFAALSPPAPPGGVADGCDRAMGDRRRAVAQVRGALERLLGGRRGLGGGDEAAVTRALTSAGTLLVSADSAWMGCRRAVRRAPGAARLPPSRWVSTRGLWSGSALGRLVAALAGSPSLAAVHRLAIVTISTDPIGVPDASGASVLPPMTTLVVNVVLADQGNVDEQGARLVVDAVPRGTGGTSTAVRTSTDIGAGDSVALSLPLSVRPGRSYVLRVTATSQEGGTSASTSVGIRVTAVTSTTTTTTTTPSATPPTSVRPG